MTEEKPCLPSQVTINIGASGVKINDDGKPAAAGFVVHGMPVDYISQQE